MPLETRQGKSLVTDSTGNHTLLYTVLGAGAGAAPRIS